MKKLWDNLKATKAAIKAFHAKSVSKSYCKVDDYRKKLASLQAHPDFNFDPELQDAEKVTIEMLKKWSLIDMSILKQKSRINCLSHGYSNSKFYFIAIKVGNAKNKIVMIHNSQGDILTDTLDIGEEIKSFYL